jgi:hypothetical protein
MVVGIVFIYLNILYNFFTGGSHLDDLIVCFVEDVSVVKERIFADYIDFILT